MADTDRSEADTGESAIPTGRACAIPTEMPEVRVEFGAVSDAGRIREHNEDHFLVARCGRAMDSIRTNVPEDDLLHFSETGYGMIVADGMGGAAAGEVASRLAITRLFELVMNVPDWILNFDEDSERRAMERADGYFRDVHATLQKKAETDPELTGMGTTLTMATIIGTCGIVTHVGDSRAYLYRNGRLMQVTHDQTHAQMLLDAGIISEEEFARHRLRHVLMQAMGTRGSLEAIEIQRISFEDGDRLLLCTDGLTDMVGDDAISTVLEQANGAQSTCDTLLQQALDNGGRDNITIVLAGVSIV